jgi:hypothetical protein
MAKFFHISFNFEGRDPPSAAIQEILEKALDWVKYAPNCYLIYSLKDEDVWFRRLRKVLDEADSIFVVEVVIENRKGWLPRRVWNWINKSRE